MSCCAAEILQNRAIWTVIPGAGVDEMAEGFAHSFEIYDLGIDLGQMVPRQTFHIGAGAGFVLIEGQQSAAIFDGESQCAGAAQKVQLVYVLIAEVTISVVVAQRLDQVDVLVISDRVRGQAGVGRNVSDMGAIPIWRIFSYRKLLSRIEDLCPG